MVRDLEVTYYHPHRVRNSAMVRWFEHFITFVIVLNSVFLAIIDYSFRVYPNKVIPGNQMVEGSELPFTLLFLFEFMCKALAMGFVLGKGTYLRDAWNVLDFIVVVFG